jgi:hypothetical protein
MQSDIFEKQPTDANTVVLPSGASKLTEVNPNSGECSAEERRNIFQAQSGGTVNLPLKDKY